MVHWYMSALKIIDNSSRFTQSEEYGVKPEVHFRRLFSADRVLACRVVSFNRIMSVVMSSFS